jgi:hypothetical protein
MPRQRQTSRKLEVFTVQAHFGKSASEAVNYRRLFQAIAEATRAQRTVTILGKSLALPDFRLDEDLVVLTAYEGEEGNPLFFNFEKATERIERLSRGEKLATKTHCAIDIATREAVVEYNFRGAKAGDIAEAIQAIGRSLTTWSDLEVELTPVVDQSFIQAVNSFQRIRVATVKMVRPNQDWTDYATHITDIADESRGGSIEVTVNAKRSSSLSERSGIMRFIKETIRTARQSIKTAKVTGTRAGEDAETTVTTEKHIAHQKVSVELNNDGLVNDPEINDRAVRFLESRNPRNGQ